MYNEFRYVESSNFRFKAKYKFETASLQADGKNRFVLLNEGYRFFAMLDDTSLNAGFKTDQEVQTETGLMQNINSLQVLFKYWQTLKDSFNSKLRITFVYNNQSYRPIELIDIAGRKTYLACSLRAVQNE